MRQITQTSVLIIHDIMLDLIQSLFNIGVYVKTGSSIFSVLSGVP